MFIPDMPTKYAFVWNMLPTTLMPASLMPSSLLNQTILLFASCLVA